MAENEKQQKGSNQGGSGQQESSGLADRAMAKEGWTEELNKLLPEDGKK